MVAQVQFSDFPDVTCSLSLLVLDSATRGFSPGALALIPLSSKKNL